MMKNSLAIGLILFQILFLSGCKEDTMLLSNLDQYRANKIISTLQSHGIESSKIPNKKGTAFNIIINKADLADATVILNAKGPFVSSKKLASPCEFKGLIATPAEEKQCEKYRLETELEKTIGQIDGVLSAEVHIVIPAKAQRAYNSTLKASSAAVFIKHQMNIDLSPYKTKIKRLIEKSVPNLTYDKVSLILIPAVIAQSGYVRPSKQQDNSNILLAILIVLLLASWIAFFFKKQLQDLPLVKSISDLLLNKKLESKKPLPKEGSPELG